MTLADKYITGHRARRFPPDWGGKWRAMRSRPLEFAAPGREGRVAALPSVPFVNRRDFYLCQVSLRVLHALIAEQALQACLGVLGHHDLNSVTALPRISPSTRLIQAQQRHVTPRAQSAATSVPAHEPDATRYGKRGASGSFKPGNHRLNCLCGPAATVGSPRSRAGWQPTTGAANARDCTSAPSACWAQRW